MNKLLIAPTGWGKTRYAISILNSHEPIVVYTSPLKSILDEVKSSVARKTTLLTGEVYEEEDDPHGDVILTTYEKLDSLIRKNYDWLSRIKIIIIDEIHNMTQRPAIEMIILWALMHNVKLIGLSATVANPEQLANWMKAELEIHTERPIKQYFTYFDPKFGLRGDIERRITLDQIMQDYTLIFAGSKRRAREFQKELGGCVLTGAMSRSQKAEIIEKYVKGECRPLIATTVIGQGVNLPIKYVYFRDTYLPYVENNVFLGWRDLTLMEIMQIAGRAGRKGFSDEGIIIFPDKSYYDLFKLRHLEPVKPMLEPYALVLFALARGYDVTTVWKSRFEYTPGDEIQINFVLSDMEALGLIRGRQVTQLGKTVLRSYLPFSVASLFITSDDTPLKTVLRTMSKKERDILKALWHNEKPDAYPMEIANTLSRARWYSFSLWMIRRVQGKDEERAKRLFFRMQSLGKQIM